MKLRTMGVRHAEALRGEPTWHVISIASTPNERAHLSPDWGCVTYVTLADDSGPDPRAIEQLAQAVRLAVHGCVTGLLVHCQLGVSRSVGVARAVAACYGLAYDHAHHGNSAIKRALLGALRPSTDEPQWYL